jgi:hypothetical protein
MMWGSEARKYSVSTSTGHHAEEAREHRAAGAEDAAEHLGDGLAVGHPLAHLLADVADDAVVLVQPAEQLGLLQVVDVSGSEFANSVICLISCGSTAAANAATASTSIRKTTATAWPRRRPRRWSQRTTGSRPIARNAEIPPG